MKEARAQWNKGYDGKKDRAQERSRDGKKIGRLLEEQREGGAHKARGNATEHRQKERGKQQKEDKMHMLALVERKERDSSPGGAVADEWRRMEGREDTPQRLNTHLEKKTIRGAPCTA
jgi:hypothetical protein